MKNKITSRKFLAALSGVLIGVGVIISGDTVEGIVTVLTSVIGYLVAEGMIDAKAVKTSAEAVEEIAAEVAANVAYDIINDAEGGKHDELLQG